MTSNDILIWVRQEFEPVELATADATILQMIRNAIRYFNTHSAYPVVKMFPCSGAMTKSIQITPDFKNVVQVYPATSPDWILQNYPLWSLLGITVIDNLTSDLIMLSEAFRNYRYYMGTDFKFTFQKSEDPTVGGVLYISNFPNGGTSLCCVGTKRIITNEVSISVYPPCSGGTLLFVPITPLSFSLTDGNITFTDDGNGNLTGSLSGYHGVINYNTGVWTTNYTFVSVANSFATYEYNEDIKSDYLLSWILYYVKALVKQCEGNILRKVDAIEIKNDGNQLFQEGKDEKAELEKKLAIEGRWLSFIKRF